MIASPTCDRCGQRLHVHSIVTRIGSGMRMRRAECTNHDCERSLFRRPADEPEAPWEPLNE